MAFVFAFLGVLMILLGIVLGGELGLFIDMPSLAIVGGITFCFTFAHHSIGATFKAFGAGLSNNRLPASEANRHIHILTTLRVLASASGVVGSLIGFVNMLANMDDPKSIGPAMAVALLTLLYGVLIAELFAAPLINRLRNRVVGDEALDKPITVSVVTVVAVPVTVASFFVLLLSFNPLT